jgi:hypothetical protein
MDTEKESVLTELSRIVRRAGPEKTNEQTKEFKELRKSVNSLTRVLNKRAGKSSDNKDILPPTSENKKESSDEKENTKNPPQRPIIQDFKEFGEGLISPFTGIKKYLSLSKTEENKTETVAKALDANKIATPEEKIEPTLENTISNELEKDETAKKDIPKKDKKEKQTDNRMLASISMMLNELRENKVQNSLLQETIKMRQILEQHYKIEPTATLENTNQQVQSNDIMNVVPKDEKPEATGIEPGIEPNNEETKSKDRELLAQAIATKLAALLDNEGPNIPSFSKSSGAKPAAAGAAGLGALGIATLGTVAAGGIATSVAATSFLDTPTGKDLGKTFNKENDPNGMASALSGDTGLASNIMNANEDKEYQDIRVEQQDEQKALKDAPWYTRIYGIGKDAYLKEHTKELKTLNSNNSKTINALPDKKNLNTEQKISSEELKETGMFDSNDIAPKPSPISQSLNQQSVSSMLDNVSKTNKELKDNLTGQSQIAQPIITNRTVNNNNTTAVPANATAVPMNGYDSWHRPRMNFN